MNASLLFRVEREREMGRRSLAPCCEGMGLKRGWWTAEEDMKLISYIQKYGHENWRTLPIRAGLLRCGKSCRLRWVNYLRPGLKHGNYTKEEKDIIIKLHEMLGNQWAKIAACLPGRTDNEIKNIWNTHLRKRLQPKKPAPVFKTAASIYGEGEGSTENVEQNPDRSDTETSIDMVTKLAGTGNTSEAHCHYGISSNTLPANSSAFANAAGANNASWRSLESLIDENDLIVDPFESGYWNDTAVCFGATATATGFQDVGKDYIEFDDSARWLEELA